MSAAATNDAYPKTLKHPNYTPAVLGKGDAAGVPAKFTPVTVHDGAQEEFWRAKGYTPAGPNFAYQGAVEAGEIAGGGGLDWPKWHAGANRSAKDEADWARAEAEAPLVKARAAAQKIADEQAKAMADPKHAQARMQSTLEAVAAGQAQLVEGQTAIAGALTSLADAIGRLAPVEPAQGRRKGGADA